MDTDASAAVAATNVEVRNDRRRMVFEEGVDEMEAIREMNARHAVVCVSGRTVILNEDFDAATSRIKVSYSDATNLRLRYKNRVVLVDDSLGVAPPGVSNSKKVPLGDYWLTHPERREYSGVAFCPGIEPPPGFYNMYRGFAFEPAQGDCSLFWDHARENICAGDGDHYRYLRKWMAHAVQRPTELPGVAVVLQGTQGVGKTLFIRYFGALFGPHFVPLYHMSQVAGRFNSHLADVLVVQASETTCGGDKASEGVLKGLITDEIIPVERKFQDVVCFRNYKRLLVDSNEDWVVPMGMDDRRFFFLRVGEKRKRDNAYFGDLDTQMKNGGYEALLHDLLNEDLSGFDVRNPPATGHGFDNKLRSMGTVAHWFYETLCDGVNYERWAVGELVFSGWATTVPKDALHGRYVSWCKRHDRHRPEPRELFTKTLKRLLPALGASRPRVRAENSPFALDGTERPWCYEMPSLGACRGAFQAVVQEDDSIWPDGQDLDAAPGVPASAALADLPEPFRPTPPSAEVLGQGRSIMDEPGFEGVLHPPAGDAGRNTSGPDFQAPSCDAELDDEDGRHFANLPRRGRSGKPGSLAAGLPVADAA